MHPYWDCAARAAVNSEATSDYESAMRTAIAIAQALSVLLRNTNISKPFAKRVWFLPQSRRGADYYDRFLPKDASQEMKDDLISCEAPRDSLTGLLSLMRRFNSGKYILTIRGRARSEYTGKYNEFSHAVAMVDGVIIDDCSAVEFMKVFGDKDMDIAVAGFIKLINPI